MHEVLHKCASTVKFVKLHACGVHIVLLLSGKIISFPDRFFPFLFVVAELKGSRGSP